MNESEKEGRKKVEDNLTSRFVDVFMAFIL